MIRIDSLSAFDKIPFKDEGQIQMLVAFRKWTPQIKWSPWKHYPASNCLESLLKHAKNAAIKYRFAVTILSPALPPELTNKNGDTFPVKF